MNKSPKNQDNKEKKKARLAASLRENLAKRKAQSRARENQKISLTET